MLSPVFISNPFLSLVFFFFAVWCSVYVCWWLQWWPFQMAGRESNDHACKYVQSHLVFFWLFLFSLLLSAPALILFLNNALSSSFSNPIFYRWTFLCCCVAQCFTMLMPSMVISPNGRSGKWRPCIIVRTLFSPPSPRSGLFFVSFFFPFFFLCWH